MSRHFLSKKKTNDISENSNDSSSDMYMVLVVAEEISLAMKNIVIYRSIGNGSSLV